MTARRLLCVVATAAVGVVAALAFASPASAHTVQVTGSAKCQSDTGTWLVTWQVTNHWTTTGQIDSVAPPIDGVAVGTDIAPGQSITATQVVAGNGQQSVSLTVGMIWPKDKFHASDTGTVPLVGPCEKPSPKPKPSEKSPTPSAPPVPASAPVSSAPGLPVTGTPTIAVAGAALVLIAGGTLLVLLGRRRRGAAQ